LRIVQPTSDKHGSGTSNVEVTNVSPFGFWLLLSGEELYLAFADFPWFRDATIAELDVDVAVESIRDPQRFPLMSRAGPSD
jgi:hypothetical protein